MEVLGALLGSVYEMFNIEIQVLGFSFSFWQVMLWVTVAGIIFTFIRSVFFD